jgi:glycosyl transferase family 92
MSEGKDVLPDDAAARRASLEDWAAEQQRPIDAPRRRVRTGARKVRDWVRRARYIRARWPRPLGTRPPIALAVCAVFRDEARYLAEWVSFHRIQGVERFYLYDNRSTDDWRSELRPEIEAGIVEVRDWPFLPGQRAAYEDCLRRHRDDARWIAFIDCDEFLFSPTGKRLPEILRGFDTHPGVVANWRVYGTSGWEQPPDGLVIENYLMRAPDEYDRNRQVKSIVNPRGALGQAASAHHFGLRGDAVGEDRRPVEFGITREPPTADLLRINHYYTKSQAEFERKREIPRVSTGLPFGGEAPVDAIRDETILQFAPALRELLSSR